MHVLMGPRPRMDESRPLSPTHRHGAEVFMKTWKSPVWYFGHSVRGCYLHSWPTMPGVQLTIRVLKAGQR